jgi:hypothetical protein
MFNGLMLQHNPNCNPNWMAYVLCQYYHFGVDIAHFLQKGEWNWYNINSFNVPFDSTASTFFTWVHTPVSERKNSNKKKKSQVDLRVVTVVMKSVWSLKNHHRSSSLPHLGPEWELFVVAPYVPNSDTCLTWVEAKNYQQEIRSCR